MNVLQKLVAPPDVCSYLPDRLATMEYQLVTQLDNAEYEALMDRGYRKFGPLLFRPVCESCRECRPLRVWAPSFRPDRSQRRAFKQNQDLRVTLQAPTVDAQRLDLYRRYHAAQSERKGWPDSTRNAEEYAFQFVRNPVNSVEIGLWEGDSLVAIVLTDVTPNVVSGVYHFYDPGLANRSLGTYCLLRTIDLARHLGKPWVYFGYYVRGCGSLSYKARFQPCEVMDSTGRGSPLHTL